MNRLTVFTPTYNRAYILPDLYNSLCTQTCHDFEWLVVDDGSTDNTRELIDGWIKDGKINIRYIYQENAGKMMAHNKAVNEMLGRLFVCIDSDDYLCSKELLSDALLYWEEKNGDTTEQVCGMAMYNQYCCGAVPFSENVEQSQILDVGEHGFTEGMYFFKSEVLRKYLFPRFEDEKFVTETYIYDQIDREYKFLLFPYSGNVLKCRFQQDGYTTNYLKVLFSNPLGFRAYHNQCVEFRKRGWLKSVICYIALSIRVGCRGMLAEAADKKLTILLFPLGILKYFYDNYRLSHL